MEEDDVMFDPTTKKKKKGKKKPFDLDAALAGEETTTEGGSAEPGANAAGDEVKRVQEDGTGEKMDAKLTNDFAFDDFDTDKKKKKKKKTTFDMSGVDEALPAPEVKTEEDFNDNMEDTAGVTSEDMDFGFPLKKKKPKKQKLAGDASTGGGDDDIKGVGEGTGQKDEAWAVDSDRDYTYDELLGRVFDIMREKNPEMVAGEKKRFVMKPPQVMKAGTKKTAFSNFADMCKMLHRQPKHLLAFLLAELGTSGSLDGSNQLIIKGRFQQKQIENVLRRYIKEYVTCHTCRSPDTSLQRDTRLYFLQCETCGSRCSVASIRSGFQAVTGKRAALRAKTT